jgi:hypothetical protein
MAKTESTAVNELIALVQNEKQPSTDPAADLFAAPAPAAMKVNPPRMTSQVPPLRGAGEVEPLPRGRAPHSTAELAMTPQVRMSTADPERGNTIPPLSSLTPSRTTSPARPVTSIPPPRKTPRATGAQRISTRVPAQRPPSQPPAPPHQRASTRPPQPPHQRAPMQPPAPPHPRASTQPLVPPHPRASTPDPMRPSQLETLRPGSMPALPLEHVSAPMATVPVERVSSPMATVSVERVSSPMATVPVERVTAPMPTLPVERVTAPIAQRFATQMPIASALAPLDIDQTPLPPPYTEISPLPGPLPSQTRATVPSMAGTPLPIQSRPTVPSAAALPLPVPQQYPIVSSASIDARPDWLAAVPKARRNERSEGTAVVVRHRHNDTLALVKKLIVPAILAAILGALVGVYFALDGRTGKASKAPVAAAVTNEDATRVAMPVVGHRATEPGVTEAATSASVGLPEPPTKAEEVADVAAARAAEANESMIPAATSAAVSAAVPSAAGTATTTPAATATAPTAPAAPPTAGAATRAPASTPTTNAPASATATAPTNVREVRTLRGVVKLVDVRIDSKPAGAEVMLVDNGKTSFLGSTPLATSVDASRKYDLIFTLPGRPTKMAPLDPAQTTKVEVRIHRGTSSSKEAVPASKLGTELTGQDAVAADGKTERAAAAPAKPAKPAKVARTDAVGEGTLMVSSKPPCEIIIDGKPTGLTTPQRSIPLPAGPHKVTFVNAAEGIHKTVSVTIVADQATKLIQDLMAK